MSMIQSDLLLGQEGGAGYVVERSLRFSSIDSAFLSRDPSTNGNSNKFTFSAWLKLSKIPTALTSIIGGGASGIEFVIGFNSSAQFFMQEITGGGSTTYYNVTSTAVFRDPSSWYHITVALDTTEATGSNRIKLWVNGSAVQLNFNTTPSLNYSTLFADSTYKRGVGAISANHTNYAYLDGYLADVFYVDGQALDPSSFVETSATTGQLIPKAYTGSFGTNGFWLKFSDNSAATATTLGKDYSGNSNNWTPNNLSVTAGAGNDSLVDTPTSYGTDARNGGEVRGNYCTWNPLDQSGITFSNGNLDTTGGGICRATFGLASGKWYWEQTVITKSDGANNPRGGVATASASLTNDLGAAATQWVMFMAGGSNGGKGYNASTITGSGSAFSVNDVAMFAYDADAGKLWFGRNGTWITGDPAAGTSPFFSSVTAPVFPVTQEGSSSSVVNYGQRAFSYQAPSGFKALCDTNLPAPVVAKPNTLMDVLLYTGNGASSRSVTGLAFSPEFVWIKKRSAAAGHGLFDVVRGAANALHSNNTGTEAANSVYGKLSSFDSTGFTVADGTDPSDPRDVVNVNGATYAAWCFDAGSNTVSNTQGSITSQVRANASAGFSIVTYTGNGTTGATVGHGLNAAPQMIFTKMRNSGIANWNCWHTSLASGHFISLNTTNASGSQPAYFTTTLPTSSVFYLGNDSYGPNANGITQVAYCWAPVAGYSSFGSYTGNGSADGPFVFCGFRPRWIMWKCTTAAYDWDVYDAVRDPYNAAAARLKPNSSDAEATLSPRTFDILSNGFKLREGYNSSNASSQTYVYAAFAESPFAYSRAR